MEASVQSLMAAENEVNKMVREAQNMKWVTPIHLSLLHVFLFFIDKFRAKKLKSIKEATEGDLDEYKAK